jgi:penicillin-binding protein 2
MRFKAYTITLLLLFFFLGLVLFWVQVFRGGYYYHLSLRNSIRLISEVPRRGKILDRNQKVLADNIISFDVVVTPQEFKNKKHIFQRLSEILSKDPETLSRIYEKGYLNPFTPVVIASGVPKTTAIIVEEEGLDLGGVSVQLNARRYYPLLTGACHVLGYMGEIDKSRITKLKDYGYDIKDLVGYSGIEEEDDLYLRGERGGQQVEVDSAGRQVRMLGYKPPLVGKDVELTLDLDMQSAADNLLKGKKGAFVLLDIETGEVFVLSSAPAFDPNIFVEKKDRKALSDVLTSSSAPLFNRAISGQFPPGSVFKIVTAVAALKNKKITPATSYLCPGSLKVGNRNFKCWSTHGLQDFYQAMAYSCDVYFYRLSILAGADAMTEAAHDFGFAAVTGIDLSHEATGFIPSRLWKRLKYFDNWYDGDSANFSIGQGFVLVTPLQLARMMATVANGGYLVEPYLTKAVDGVSVERKEPKRIDVPEDVIGVIKESLRLPVQLESGTAHSLEVAGLEICAKTGTAQVFGAKAHGWVAGFFPMSKPKYAFCILLENVDTSHYACELGREFFQEMKEKGKWL